MHENQNAFELWRQDDNGNRFMIGTFACRAAAESRLAELTPREHEVMGMVTEGKSNKDIATALGVTPKTVEAHRARVMEKMRADSLAELVRMALIAHQEG